MNKELEIALTTYIALKHTQEECIGFIDGFEAAEEIMYSEEEVLELIWKYETRQTSMVGYGNVKKWFEQFKKK